MVQFGSTVLTIKLIVNDLTWLLTVPNGATTSATTTTAKPDAEQLKKMADDQLQLQDAVSAMLVQTHAIGSCESPDVQVQFEHTTKLTSVLPNLFGTQPTDKSLTST